MNDRFCRLSPLLGPSYIRLNQSAIRPVKQQQVQLKNQHKDIYSKVEDHLYKHQHMPKTASIMKQYSTHLLNYFSDCYFAPLKYNDQLQAQEQAHIAGSIRNNVRKHRLTLRVTDKSNNFYIGLKDNYERKVERYFSETNAFIEITDNHFQEIFDKVTHSLKAFASKKLIFQWQLKAMLPDPKTTELSHLYFNPKTNKVW